MSIKITSNPKFADPGKEAATIDPQMRDQANKLIADLEINYQGLEGGKDYYEHLSAGDQAKIESMKERIKGTITLLKTFIETGKWPGVAGAYGDAGLWSELPELESGWHGTDIQYMDYDDDEYLAYEDAVAMSYDAGELEDVILIPKGSIDPSFDTLTGAAVGLVIKDDDNVERITKKTVGEDIWVTVDYTDKDSKTWVLKGLAVRTDVMIYTSAQQCNNAVIMDDSQVVRVSKDSGDVFNRNSNGTILIGGNGDDILIGSANDDIMVGGYGNDKMYGLGGWDTMIGDGAVKNEADGFLNSVNDASGGDDFMDGGAGFDVIRAGGGANDTVVKDSGQAYDTDQISEEEPTIDFKDRVDFDDLSDFKKDISLNGWGSKVDKETGEVVITKGTDFDPADNSIKIVIPDGYTMVYADKEGDDTIITLACMAEDEEGDPAPVYLRVRIEGVLATGNQTAIEVAACDAAESGGSIIDFSRLNAAGNNVVLKGSEDDDILLGPSTNLDDLHITAEELANKECSKTKSEMEKILDVTDENDTSKKVKWGGDNWAEAYATSEEIVLKPKDSDLDSITFAAPGGFDSVDGVFYDTDDSGNLMVYIIHVTDEETGDFEMLKVKIVGMAQAMPHITVGGVDAQAIGTVEFDSGEGSDLVVGNIGSTTDWDASEEDTILKGWQKVAEKKKNDPLEEIDGVPVGLHGEKAEYNKKPVKDENGDPLNWEEPAPSDPDKNIWEVVKSGEDPNKKQETTES